MNSDRLMEKIHTLTRDELEALTPFPKPLSEMTSEEQVWAGKVVRLATTLNTIESWIRLQSILP